MSQGSTIVITGTGLITSLGRGREAVFREIARGKVGLGPMPALEQQPEPNLGGGQAIDIEPSDHSDEDRAITYLRAAIDDALKDAALPTETVGERTATVLGSTLHGMRSAGKYLRTKDTQELKTFLAGSVLERAIEHLLLGPVRMTTCAACSSGLSSVGLGMTLLRAGLAEAVIAGGYDAVSEYAYAGFNALRLVSPESLRPFGQDRQGMKIAEGYGVLVLETLERAHERGASVLGVVAGYDESSDSFHLTQPMPEGEGAARAALGAIREAQQSPEDVGLVAAHATGTPHNDAAEYQALAHTFGGALPSIPVVGLKGALGHTLGGAGAVEVILSLEAMRTGTAPPTHGADRRDQAFENLSIRAQARTEREIRSTLNLSLGFGGSNTAVVLREWMESHDQPAQPSHEAVVTGVGVVLPGIVGFDTLQESVRTGLTLDGPAIEAASYAHLITARRLRRVSEYAKLSLASASDAVRHAGLADDAEALAGSSAILGTMHGSSAYCEQYYEQIVEEGLDAANPVLFAEGVPNAAAAHLSMGLGLRGGCQTIIGSRTAGLEALLLAALRVREGRAQRCIVTAAEEHSEIANRAHAGCGRTRCEDATAGSVSFVVESQASATARGARVLCTLDTLAWEGPGETSWESKLGGTGTILHDGAPARAGAHADHVEGDLPEMYSARALVLVARMLAQGSVGGGVVCHAFNGRAAGLSWRGE